jgi:hypothetical protein
MTAILPSSGFGFPSDMALLRAGFGRCGASGGNQSMAALCQHESAGKQLYDKYWTFQIGEIKA